MLAVACAAAAASDSAATRRAAAPGLFLPQSVAQPSVASGGRRFTRKVGQVWHADKGDRSVALRPSLWKRARRAISNGSTLRLKMHELEKIPC
jgi:hypothetical protein